MRVAELLRQSTPLAAMLGHVQDRIEHPELRQARVPLLLRQQRSDPFVLPIRKLQQLDPPAIVRPNATHRRKPQSG